MARARTTKLILSLTAATTLCSQGDLSAQGTPFKREIDTLINFLQSAKTEKNGLGDGSCRQTAMVLTAMAYSHRAYHLGDGPKVTLPRDFLFACRRADGSFGDALDKDPVTTTRWVVEALAALDDEAHESDVATARAFLKSRGKDGSIFREMPLPKDPGAIAKSLGRGPLMKDGKPAMEGNVRALLALVRLQSPLLQKASPAAKPDKPARKPTFSATQQKGFDFLMTRQKEGKFFMMIPIGKDKFMEHFDLGMTGMGLAALQTKPASMRSKAEQTTIDKGLVWLQAGQNDNGSFGKQTINYATCAAIMAIARAERPELKETLAKAKRYILGIQNIDGSGYQPSDRDYGSIGYGGDQRGDLSNTQFAVEALRSAGVEENAEALAKAIIFLQRTQNLKSVNDFKGKTKDPKTGKWQRLGSGNDGGSAYYPGNSPAGYILMSDGTKIPRSYGSMTYALLKTYTLCGIKSDDQRVVAAVEWIQKNFNLDANPGSDPKLPAKYRYQGLYYYYMVMAQALDIVGIETVRAPKGEKDKDGKPTIVEIDWRKALREKLASLQQENGSWLNTKNDRWFEGLDLVCSMYTMIALDSCR